MGCATAKAWFCSAPKKSKLFSVEKNDGHGFGFCVRDGVSRAARLLGAVRKEQIAFIHHKPIPREETAVKVFFGKHGFIVATPDKFPIEGLIFLTEFLLLPRIRHARLDENAVFRL